MPIYHFRFEPSRARFLRTTWDAARKDPAEVSRLYQERKGEAVRLERLLTSEDKVGWRRELEVGKLAGAQKKP
jgi:hypothetical protein